MASMKEQRRKVLNLALVALIVFIVFAALLMVGFYLKHLVNPRLTMEVGEPLPSAEAFKLHEGPALSYAGGIEDADNTQVGETKVKLKVLCFKQDAVLEYVDTVAPSAKPVDREIWCGDTVRPEDFVSEAKDNSPLTYAYLNSEPDTSVPGESDVVVVLTDAGGNTIEVTARLTVVADTEAPVIEGVKDIEVRPGDSPSYRDGITVTDNRDEAVELNIDSSAVDPSKAGVYPVVYSAVDAAGNEACVEASVRVVADVPGSENFEQMEELSQKALSECLKDGMSDREKLQAIHTWVSSHMSYTGDSDKSSYINEAIRGFTGYRGDCFTYFSMMKAMMEDAGFNTVDLKRVGGRTEHYWSLVYVEDQWLHIDACPRSKRSHGDWICFLRTDEEVKNFSETMVSNYYNYDPALYPAEN